MSTCLDNRRSTSVRGSLLPRRPLRGSKRVRPLRERERHRGGARSSPTVIWRCVVSSEVNTSQRVDAERARFSSLPHEARIWHVAGITPVAWLASTRRNHPCKRIGLRRWVAAVPRCCCLQPAAETPTHGSRKFVVVFRITHGVLSYGEECAVVLEGSAGGRGRVRRDGPTPASASEPSSCGLPSALVTSRASDTNVDGAALAVCSTAPLTGFFRDG